MEKFIKNLKTIYFMFLASPILIIVVFLLMTQKGTVMLNNNFDTILMYVVPIFALIFITAGFVIFIKNLKNIQTEENFDSKISRYKGIIIQRFAIFEGIAILSVVAFMITLNNYYIIYTFLSLLCFIPIYPTIGKINKDLKISTNDKLDQQVENKKSNNFFKQNPWLIIPIIALMLLLNYNTFKELFTHKVVLPAIQPDSGIIKDSIYKNDYLGWTIRIPYGYSVIPISVLEKNEKKGKKIYGNNSIDDKPIRLLNITNGIVNFQSTLNPRVLYPNLTSEEKYIETIDKKLLGTTIDSLKIEKGNQGAILIDKIEFKFAEYIMTHESSQVKMIYFSKFDKDYMLDISISSRDTIEGKKMLDHLKNSKLDWK